MGDVAQAIERGNNPYLALDDHNIVNSTERETLTETIATMQRLHSEGRNHIWAYYTRNLVRPVALSRSKVDVIVGNPPWLNYNKAVSTLRTELERQSKNVYGIWAGGKYATHQDVAGLFYARSVDLYLKDGGVIGMVMPHSALQAGHYAKWRRGSWAAARGLSTLSVDFSYKSPWDLEKLKPNTFFPVPASVAFAKRLGVAAKGTPLSGKVQRWQGRAGAVNVRRVAVPITNISASSVSPYDGYSRLGAILYPRCLLFVIESENPAIIQVGQTVTANPRRGSQDKEPWRSLDLTNITDQTIETQHLFDVYLGETLVPYATLDPLKAILPLKHGDDGIPRDPEGVGGVNLGALRPLMRERWQTISALWETYKQPVNKLDLISQLDYWGHLSAQMEWQHSAGDRPIRVVYTKSGQPTAAVLHEDDALLDHKLFWIACKDAQEANYLLAIINSAALYEAVSPLMAKGLFGARDLQKHLWKLPIPAFNPGRKVHAAVAKAGEAAVGGTARQLAKLRQERGDVSVTIARRELRKWLRESKEGKAVERAVSRLLAG